MADPITNAQFALGLFQPALQAQGRANERNLALGYKQADDLRKDALTYWHRKMDREDAEDERDFRDQQSTKAIAAQLAGQSESTKRIIAQMDATEKRQKESEVRKLYDEYNDLTRDAAKPLAEFGKDVDEQFQALSREVGKIKQTTLLAHGVADAIKKYTELGGKETIESGKFGKTPAEQLQAIGAASQVLSSKRAKDNYVNVSRELSMLGDQIAEAEKLTPEEVRQAKSIGLQSLGKDARDAYLRLRGTLGEDAALARIEKTYPADVDEYRNNLNRAIVGLRIQKRDNDKVLRELHDNASQLRVLKTQAALRIGENDPNALLGLMSGKQTSAAPSVSGKVGLDDMSKPTPKVGEQDARRTTLNNVAPNTLFGPPLPIKPYLVEDQEPAVPFWMQPTRLGLAGYDAMQGSVDSAADFLQNRLPTLFSPNQMMPPELRASGR